ncbi:MAG: amidohydrolase/deacetylase family metallohydrolase [Defluviitaleaceae bacterium]|nr:amidohydrolase/deacetylase family metallohydrolase [Defluviitaleaceae bacterium]
MGEIMESALLIKNGHVIDPLKSEIKVGAIGIKNGRFVPVEEVMSSRYLEVIDAAGSYVAPGFIDMHVHVFKDYTELGIDPDKIGIEQGVTTVVDAGSTGSEDFGRFKDAVIDKSQTEILTFLNISTKGLCHGLSELADMNNLMTLDEFNHIRTNEPSIVGLKARMSSSVVKQSGIKPLIYARGLAEMTDVPIMTHIGNPPPNLEEIFPLLKEGDIVTHAFHGKKHGILDEEGHLIPDALAALKRGVLFDVGHGTDSFSFETLMKYKEKYAYPFTISTDIYLKNYHEPVGSLMLTMSKLMHLGYTLDEVVKSVTIGVKEILNLKEQGTLEDGTRADVTIFNVVHEQTEIIDSMGMVMIANQVLEPVITLREGKVVYKNES